jgi:hypothetical protein
MTLTTDQLRAVGAFLEALGEASANDGVTVDSGSVIWVGDGIAGYLEVQADEENGTTYALRPSGSG